MTASAPERILCVDDDPDLLALLGLALAEWGPDGLRLCTSGAQALKLAEAFRPDLVVLDVCMPELDGPDTLQALRRIPALADTPVVFMTAGADPADAERYRSQGAAAVIPKPFDPRTLGPALAEVWREHRQHCTQPDGMEDQLATLQGRFVLALRERLRKMDQIWARLDADPRTRRAALLELQQQVHQILGSAGSFGLAEISERARPLDDLLLQRLERQRDDPDLCSDLAALWQGLRGAILDASQREDFGGS